jgi:hypothetical protein
MGEKNTTLIIFLDRLFPKIKVICEMLRLEIKHSRGKLLIHSDLQGGMSLEETSHSTHYRKIGKDPHQYRNYRLNDRKCKNLWKKNSVQTTV